MVPGLQEIAELFATKRLVYRIETGSESYEFASEIANVEIVNNNEVQIKGNNIDVCIPLRQIRSFEVSWQDII